MLLNLSIQDLAVVQSLSLDFEPGLSVLTGETGAGKSILLTALGLALGDRADSGYIRAGSSKAEINLQFSLADAPEAKTWLQENELLDEEETCLLRRVVSQDGRSKAFINGRPSTLQSLQELASRLVEIHGQHAHLRLLDNEEQRRLLDSACSNQQLLEKLAECFRRWKSLKEELDRLNRNSKANEGRAELLQYQIEEMEQHEIESVDYDSLSEEQTLLANMEKILSSGQSQLELLSEGDQLTISTLLSQTITGLAELSQLSPGFEDILQMLEEARIQIKEASAELRHKLDRMEADPRRLAWLDEKLGDLLRLSRKHHIPPQELKEFLQNLKTELNGLESNSEQIETIAAQLESVLQEYNLIAAELSAARQKGAERLSTRISALMQELGMPQGQFRVTLNADPQSPPTAQGYDRVEFLVSANPGLPPKSLAKVASGGELSRISLAIQVAATDAKATPTLVFDEVDTGIGGGVAEVVGQKLRTLGLQHQIFCVTHLHQVAAQGHHHLLVAKSSTQGNTETQVFPLNYTLRKQEIARMLGGVRITEQTLAHAEELLLSVDISNPL